MPWTSSNLAVAVLTTLQDVLVHQRARWAALFAHQYWYEGWWKAEFALALESWCWRMDLPEPTWVLSEVKPRDFGIGLTLIWPLLSIGAPRDEEGFAPSQALLPDCC